MTAAPDRPIIYTHHCGSPLGGITLTSDGGGLNRKAKLLALEHAYMSAGFMPLPRTEL